MYETTGDSNRSMSTWPTAPEAFCKSCQYCQLNLKWKLQPCTLPQMGFLIMQLASSLYFLNPHVDPCKPSHFHLLLDSHFLYLNLQQIVENLWGKTCAYSLLISSPIPPALSTQYFYFFSCVWVHSSLKIHIWLAAPFLFLKHPRSTWLGQDEVLSDSVRVNVWF